MSDNTTIGPTPERLRKAGRDVEAFTPDESIHHRAIRMLDGHVLARLVSRAVITGDQFNAGTQFYGDWYTSGLAASGVIDPGRVIVDGGDPMRESDRKLAAMTRYKRAVQAIGLIHSTVLTDLLLLEQNLEAWGRRWRGYKNRKQAIQCAQDALVFALDALVNHYYGRRHMAPSYGMVAGAKPVVTTPQDCP